MIVMSLLYVKIMAELRCLIQTKGYSFLSMSMIWKYIYKKKTKIYVSIFISIVASNAVVFNKTGNIDISRRVSAQWKFRCPGASSLICALLLLMRLRRALHKIIICTIASQLWMQAVVVISWEKIILKWIPGRWAEFEVCWKNVQYWPQHGKEMGLCLP